jgi:hypothetical protein
MFVENGNFEPNEVKGKGDYRRKSRHDRLDGLS